MTGIVVLYPSFTIILYSLWKCFTQLMDTFASSFRSDFIAKNRGIKNAYALGDLQETLKLLGEANINLKKDFDTVGIYLRYLDFLPSSLYRRLTGLVAEVVLS